MWESNVGYVSNTPNKWILELIATYEWEDDKSLLRVVLMKQTFEFKARHQHLQLINHSTKLLNEAFFIHCSIHMSIFIIIVFLLMQIRYNLTNNWHDSRLGWYNYIYNDRLSLLLKYASKINLTTCYLHLDCVHEFVVVSGKMLTRIIAKNENTVGKGCENAVDFRRTSMKPKKGCGGEAIPPPICEGW